MRPFIKGENRMKKLYYATFIPGMERAVEGLLRREGGVTVEQMLSGGVLYRSVKELSLDYMHHNFLVLTQLRGVSDVDAAIKKLLSAGDWLDRIPYDTAQGKRFRLVTMDREKLVPVNMRYLSMLEKAIIDQTGMKTLRERPDVELWIARRSEGMTLFLWRLGKRSVKPEKPGAMRSDVCTIVAALARLGGKNALNLLCFEDALLRAMKNAGARSVTGVCDRQETANALTARAAGVRILVQDPLNLSFADEEIDSVIVHLPEKLEANQPEAYLRGLFSEAQRVLRKDGRLIVVGARAQADNAIARAPGLMATDSFDILLSGRKCTVWVVEKGETQA